MTFQGSKVGEVDLSVLVKDGAIPPGMDQETISAALKVTPSNVSGASLKGAFNQLSSDVVGENGETEVIVEKVLNADQSAAAQIFLDLSGAGASSSDKVKFSVNYDGADLEATDFVAEMTIGNLDGGQVADGVSVAFVQLSIDDLLGALETMT